MIPKRITPSSFLIDLCESPPPPFSSLETAELVRISPLEVDASHEVSISKVPNPNFIAPPMPRSNPILSQLLSPTLHPSFSQPPRISTRVFTTLVHPTDNVPTVLYSHPWNSNPIPSLLAPSISSYGSPILPNPFPRPSAPSIPSSSEPAWINPYEPRPSLGSFNHCHLVNYTSNNPRIECAGYVNRYFTFYFFVNRNFKALISISKC